MDVALQYNPETRKCSPVFNGRDFALDYTPASAMLMSVLANRRAEPSDTVPALVPDYLNPPTLTARQGWAGDALDQNGQKIGSRLWLLWAQGATEQTRQNCETYLAEACDWLNTVRGLAVDAMARWLAPQFLGYRVRAGDTEVALKKAL